jgi:hypothetical protein
VKLKSRDRIDPLETGFLNFIEHLLGGGLYHCKFCRLQFYDRRKLPERLPVHVPETPEAVGPAE